MLTTGEINHNIIYLGFVFGSQTVPIRQSDQMASNVCDHAAVPFDVASWSYAQSFRRRQKFHRDSFGLSSLTSLDTSTTHLAMEETVVSMGIPSSDYRDA